MISDKSGEIKWCDTFLREQRMLALSDDVPLTAEGYERCRQLIKELEEDNYCLWEQAMGEDL